MLDELTLRRPNFGWGTPIQLADFQTWHFISPQELKSRDLSPRESAQYQSLTRAIIEAESHVELLQAELALAIFLLHQSYNLTPAGCFQVLGFGGDSAALASVQHEIHELAKDHVQARSTEPARKVEPVVNRVRRMSFLRRVRTALSA